MAHSERHEELVAASALGLPLGDERAELDRHLAEGCAVCEGLLADLRGAATALAATVPEATPPPELRAKILGALGPARVAPRETSGGLPWKALAAAAAPRPGRPRRRRRAPAPPARRVAQPDGRARGPAADDGDGAGRTGAARARARERRRPDAVARRPGSAAGCAGARVLESRARGAASSRVEPGSSASRPPVRALDLPEGQAGQRRRVRRRSAAAGRSSSPRISRSPMRPPNFAVTVEPRGGVPAPTGPIVLVGKTS